MSKGDKGMKPIETIYKDYRFRSRLEARYAVLFDALGVRWEYEKDDHVLPNGVRYLPDFWLPEQDCWIEIKGQWPSSQEERKAELLALKTKKNVYIFFGDIWIPGTPESYHIDFGEGDRHHPKGALGYIPKFKTMGGLPYRWYECDTCHKLYIALSGKYECMPCYAQHDEEYCQHLDNGGYPLAPPEGSDTTPRLIDAHRAARQARFEHGEKPR